LCSAELPEVTENCTPLHGTVARHAYLYRNLPEKLHSSIELSQIAAELEARGIMGAGRRLDRNGGAQRLGPPSSLAFVFWGQRPAHVLGQISDFGK
jgi:hypothetical protein